LNREQILKRLREIADLLKADNADVAALDKEFRELQEALKAADLRDEVQEGIKGGEEARKVDGTETPEGAKPDAEAEKRGRDLMEKRTVTVSGGSIIVPKHTGSTINPTFNETSGLIDRVSTLELPGGEAFSQPYIKSYGTGDYTAENANYADAEPVFGYADIGKTKVTAYAETTEEVRKLPAANYDGVVQRGITTALRKKVTREIMVGDGATGHFTGIFHNPADTAKQVIEPSKDIDTITKIDEHTLDEIVFAYGGSEDVEDAAVLVLNKKDLREFAKVRGADKKKVYEIKVTGNTGTIDGVPYIINSACAPISDAATAGGAYCMAYGSLSNYQAVIFSGVDIQYSTDFKFRQGNIAHRGSVFMGGNVVAYNGFIRVKKPATAPE